MKFKISLKFFLPLGYILLAKIKGFVLFLSLDIILLQYSTNFDIQLDLFEPLSFKSFRDCFC